MGKVKELFQQMRELVKDHKIKDTNDFEWTKNTRCAYDNECGDILVRITDVDFTYSYEFVLATLTRSNTRYKMMTCLKHRYDVL